MLSESFVFVGSECCVQFSLCEISGRSCSLHCLANASETGRHDSLVCHSGLVVSQQETAMF